MPYVGKKPADIIATAVDTTTGAFSGAVTLTGTTPTLTIGDGGAEDTAIVFDGNAQDFYIGLDDTNDNLSIGLGSTVGSTQLIKMTSGDIVITYDPNWLSLWEMRFEDPLIDAENFSVKNKKTSI